MPGPSTKTLILQACEKVAMTTDGQNSANSAAIDLNLPEVTRAGPRLSGVTVYSLLEGKTTNFGFLVDLFFSHDNRQWSNPVTIATVTSAGTVVSAQHTTATNFGLYMRYGIRPYNTSGGAVERGIVSVALGFDFKT